MVLNYGHETYETQLSDNKLMGFLSDSSHVRVMTPAEIANFGCPFKSVASKTFSAFPVHGQATILRIW